MHLREQVWGQLGVGYRYSREQAGIESIEIQSHVCVQTRLGRTSDRQK